MSTTNCLVCGVDIIENMVYITFTHSMALKHSSSSFIPCRSPLWFQKKPTLTAATRGPGLSRRCRKSRTPPCREDPRKLLSGFLADLAVCGPQRVTITELTASEHHPVLILPCCFPVSSQKCCPTTVVDSIALALGGASPIPR